MCAIWWYCEASFSQNQSCKISYLETTHSWIISAWSDGNQTTSAPTKTRYEGLIWQYSGIFVQLEALESDFDGYFGRYMKIFPQISNIWRPCWIFPMFTFVDRRSETAGKGNIAWTWMLINQMVLPSPFLCHYAVEEEYYDISNQNKTFHTLHFS